MPITISTALAAPYYRQVADQLADEIRSGRLPPGAALPSVRQLAADLLVSVITTKKAYEELEVAGLVVSRQGRGTFVADDAVSPRATLLATAQEDARAWAERGRRLGLQPDELLAIARDALDHVFPPEKP